MFCIIYVLRGGKTKKCPALDRKILPCAGHCVCVLDGFVFVFTVSVIKACIDII